LSAPGGPCFAKDIEEEAATSFDCVKLGLDAMTWGVGLITGRTRYAVLLMPILFMLRPAWRLCQIAVYGESTWCHPRGDTCVAVSAAREPELVRAVAIGDAVVVLVGVALVFVILLAIRREDSTKITESRHSPQMRLLSLGFLELVLLIRVFRH
jgi:hypothetical protein